MHKSADPSYKSTLPQSAREPAWYVTWVLVACTGVSILSTDLYTPSLPHIPRLLGTDAITVQLTMSLNLCAYAIAQLVHGPLADYFGRRRLLLFSMLGCIAASLACAAAQNIGGLLAGRILQGLFSSVPSVVIVIMIRELYADSRTVKVMALYGMAVGLVPAIGPLIGGYVFIWAGWRANFFMLAGIATIVLFLVMRLLPESGQRDPSALHVSRVLTGYFALLGERDFWRYVLPLSAVFGALFAFITAGPFLMIDLFGVATENYGIWYGITVLAFISGGLLATRLGGHYSNETVLQTGLVFGCVGSLAYLPLTIAGYGGPIGLTSSIFLQNFGMALIFASGPLCLFDALPDHSRGITSALLGAFQLSAAGLGSFLVGAFYTGTAIPLAGTMWLFASIGGISYLLLRPPLSEGRSC